MEHNSGKRISKVEITSDNLTSRGGLAFFVMYLESIGILDLLLEKFPKLKKSRKGVTLRNLFLQVLCFFFDGTSRHLTYFDELHKDEGYTAVIQVSSQQMASSHAIKRFFNGFTVFATQAFRFILKRLFLWRLRLKRPPRILLTLDTMVMNNDEALKREGCDPTYKKVKGFQPLQIIWEGKIVDAIFRRGKKHSNYGHDAKKMIKGIVKWIRENYDSEVEIVIRLDGGFFDEKIFTLCDELKIGFIGTGKMIETIKEQVEAIKGSDWKVYDNGHQKWQYAEFEYKCDKWKRGYRALYTRPEYDEDQRLLEFARPDNIILTNLQAGEPAFERLAEESRKDWTRSESIIHSHHQRGADELPHRALKEFGSEELPFKRFAQNNAYYYFMLVTFFLFETFKEDNLEGILPIGSYAKTVRRKLVDLAAKIVRTAHETILKVSKAAMEALRLDHLITRCRTAPKILQV